MTKTLGFLTGVCLTVAAFVVVLDRWQFRQPDETSRVAVATDVEPPDAAPSVAETVSVTTGALSARTPDRTVPVRRWISPGLRPGSSTKVV